MSDITQMDPNVQSDVSSDQQNANNGEAIEEDINANNEEDIEEDINANNEEDIEEDINANNEEDIEEDINANNGEDIDIMAELYGEEECHSGSEDEFISDICGPNTDINSNIPGITNQIQKASKRRSESNDENDGNHSKRIKSEPIDRPSDETTGQRLTTTCEPIDDSDTSVDVPKTASEFMTHLLDLNANDLDYKDINQLSMSTHLKNICKTLCFEDLNHFQKTFIPYVLMDLWTKLKVEYIRQQNISSKTRNPKHFCSILTKKKTRNGLDLRCFAVFKPNDNSFFRFGHLVLIQTAVQERPDSDRQIITTKKYFGYISSHLIRRSNPNNQSEVNYLRHHFKEGKRDSVLIEEFNLTTKFVDEVYHRNDVLIVAQPLLCVHNYYMEVRSLANFDTFPIWPQVFNPVFTSRASGVSAIFDDRRRQKLSERKIECIQIALDVVANSSLSHSSFMAIKSSEKSWILTEIVRQLVSCDALKPSKVLFTSANDESLKKFRDVMKNKKIPFYFVGNSLSADKLNAIKHIERKLTESSDEEKKINYKEILDYFKHDMSCDLSTESYLLKNAIVENIKQKQMTASPVIIGRIDDLCNDIPFYKLFTSSSLFSCCVIDDANGITEPQLYSLLWFKINRFIFGSESVELSTGQTDLCRQYGLTRSLFSRYYQLSLQNEDNECSTVFEFENKDN